MNKFEEIISWFSYGELPFRQQMESLLKCEIEDAIKELLNIASYKSSYYREFVSLSLSGNYKYNSDKNGFDGVEKNTNINVEVKSKHVKKYSKIKLNGSGTFNDFNQRIFERYEKENPYMIVSGFVDKRMIFILRFRFNKIKDWAQKEMFQIPDKRNCPTFNLSKIGFQNIDIEYLSSDWKQYQEYLSQNLCDFLISKRPEFICFKDENINEPYEKLMVQFATEDTIDQILSDKTFDELVEVITELLRILISDKNSSYFREIIVCNALGWKHRKSGFDGERTGVNNKVSYCEIKPESCLRFEKKIARKTALSDFCDIKVPGEYVKKRKQNNLSGRGFLSDYNERLLKKLKSNSVIFLHAGFCDGKLVYVLGCQSNYLIKYISNQLKKYNIKRSHARHIQWNYKQYKNNLTLKYLRTNFDEYVDELDKGLFEIIQTRRDK